MSQRWPAERTRELRERWERGERPKEIRQAMGLTPGQLAGFRTRHTLHAPAAHARRANPDTPFVLEGRTKFPGMLTGDGDALKPGQYQSKLGNRVAKGRWKGMKVYALTLEERKTCPTDCALWVECYGNNMHLAKRMRHGPELEAKIWTELGRLQARHPLGFVVRLHILGDFYSVEYVELWKRALTSFPALRVFGYTARQPSTPIGAAIAALRNARWSRFAVRTSGARSGPRTLVVSSEDTRKILGAILCPAQTGRTASCSTCSLCWASKIPVAFLRH